MKLSLLLVLLCMSSVTFSAIDPYISESNDEAYLIIQGQDSDAVSFYNALDVEEIERDGVLVKERQFFVREYSNGQPPTKSFEFLCNKSKVVKDLVSCRIGVFKSLNSYINYDSKSVLLGINDTYLAKKFSKSFNYKVEYNKGIIFKSEDSLLNVSVTFNSRKELVSFTIKYN